MAFDSVPAGHCATHNSDTLRKITRGSEVDYRCIRFNGGHTKCSQSETEVVDLRERTKLVNA